MADEKQLSAKVQSIVDAVKELSLMEVSELVKALEEEFGVSAAPVMAMGAMPAAGGTAPAEEKTEFDVVLVAAGEKKIDVIKAVRTLKPELGLADAKKVAETANSMILEGADKETADKAKALFEAAGATVELK